MLMLTHAWLLEHFLGDRCLNRETRDLFIYNICPDFLPIHHRFSSEMTHGISRFRELPAEYQKAAFIHFHLMVDDISHHGLIDKVPVRVFNPDSLGYSYLKGRPLIQPLMELYESQGKPIDVSVAAYRSHMIIEMTFDLALFLSMPEDGRRLIALMSEALQMTLRDQLDEFTSVVGWLYDINPQDIADALRQCAAVYTESRMNRFMSLDGRMQVFGHKFGLDAADDRTRACLEKIMTRGMDLVGDYAEFLNPTLTSVRKVGFNPAVFV